MNFAYNMDCLSAMQQMPDKYFDLAVVDPPYFSGPERRNFYGCQVSPIGVQRMYKQSEVWQVPDERYFDELRRVSKQQIILTILFLQGELFGINAMAPAVFLIARLPIAVCTTALDYIVICGMVCVRENQLQRAI